MAGNVEMTRLNDTPHSIRRQTMDPKKVAEMLTQPKPKPKPIKELAEPYRRHLEEGRTILLTRKGRDTWSWSDTGAKVPLRFVRWLRENGHLVALDKPLMEGQPAQTWGAP